MKKSLIAVVLAVLVLMPLMAGEHQLEGMEYERAFADGNYQEALLLAKTDVGQGNALNALGFVAYEAADYAKAKGYLERAIGADEENYWAHNTLGAILLYEGDAAGALAEFEKHLAINLKASDKEASNRVDRARKNIKTAKLYL